MLSKQSEEEEEEGSMLFTQAVCELPVGFMGGNQLSFTFRVLFLFIYKIYSCVHTKSEAATMKMSHSAATFAKLSPA